MNISEWGRESFLRPLLQWFERNSRPLPWRRDRDPYRIWISEVMLQQTTVAAVAPRFEKFLRVFPDVRALAAADEGSILKAWEGLGYYNRARNLHRAARRLVGEHAGELPDDPDVWRELPGVGRYILGAVLSQAFDRGLPIVEANTRRVLCRLFGKKGDPSSPAMQAWLWRTAETILPQENAGTFNQALMELGALVCTPEAPDCGRCPLRKKCRARQLGLQERIPRRPIRQRPIAVREVCLVIRRSGRVLLVRRPASGRWANMWEFPRVTLEEHEGPELGALRLINSLQVRARLGAALTTIRYAVTRFRMTMTCFEAKAQVATFDSAYYEEGRWLRAAEVANYPLSTPQRKLANMLHQPRLKLRLL
jgi:A/G-specific adenine glycosylase